MRKVFFVFGIIYVSKVTKEKRPYVSACTYDHYDDAFKAMLQHQSGMRRDGFYIIKSNVYRKVIEL